MEFRVYRQWQELSPAVGAGVEALLEETDAMGRLLKEQSHGRRLPGGDL